MVGSGVTGVMVQYVCLKDIHGMVLHTICSVLALLVYNSVT